MASMISPRRIQNTYDTNKSSNGIDDFKVNDQIVDNYRSKSPGHRLQNSTSTKLKKPIRALSCTTEKLELSPKKSNATNENPLRNLYTQLKRRFSGSRECRSNSEDVGKISSKFFRGYKSISSATNDSNSDFDWPDFEKIYDSIPICLVKGLPGLDDLINEDHNGNDDDDDEDTMETASSIIDENNEQLDLFEICERGPHFRRNALCHKVDKSQYNSQLNVFLQQLMIEKLVRTWA